MKNQENLEGIIAKLKQQGIEAGEIERDRILNDATLKVNKMLTDAETKAKQIIDKAKNEAAQTERNAQTAISQAARDVIEATKVALINHLHQSFGKQCETLLTNENYLSEILKTVIPIISGNKTIEINPELLPKMESFLVQNSFSESVQLKPLDKSDAKIVVTSDQNKEIQFVITSSDIQDALFSLLNKDLVNRITNSVED